MIRITLLALLLVASPFASAQGPPVAETYLGKKSNISLQDAILLSLQNNLNLQVERTDPAIAREAVEQARGAYDPVLSAFYGFDHTETPTANAVENAIKGDLVDATESDIWNYQSGFAGIVPFGLQYSSTYNMRRLETSSFFITLDPEWRPVWMSEVTLPLLRDLFLNEASVTVKRSVIAENISNEDFRARLRDEVVAVAKAYWDLAAARAELRVEEKSRQTTQDLLEQTRVQYEVGVVSKVNVTQAEAGVADRDFRVIVAVNRSENLQDALLNLVLAPGAAGFVSTQLIPDDPAYIEYHVELESAIKNALANRAEVAAAQKRVEDAEVQLAFAENQRLPALDLRASYALEGLSGDQKIAPGTPTGLTVIGLDPVLDTVDVVATVQAPDRVDFRARNAHDSFLRSDGAHGWSVSANFEIPLGNTTARSRVVQRRIELRRARTDRRRVKQSVILEMRNAVRALRSAVDGVEAAERNRLAREETLRAEQEKLRLGDSTPHNVLEFEDDLVDAERQKIAALRTYENAITGVERNKGTLLSTIGVSVEEELQRGNGR